MSIRPRAVVLGAVSVALVVVVAACAAWTMGGRDGTSPSADPTPAPPLRTESVPAPSGGTIDEVEPGAKAPRVVKATFAEPARLPGGIEVEVTDVSVRKVEALGPGEVGGRAVVTRVQVTNGSKKELDLAGSWAQLTWGPKEKVAPPQTGKPYDPLTGSLAPGASATGTYVHAIGGSKARDLSFLFATDLKRPQIRFEGDFS